MRTVRRREGHRLTESIRTGGEERALWVRTADTPDAAVKDVGSVEPLQNVDDRWSGTTTTLRVAGGTVKGVWTEFKAFALGGNMLDLALGFIIGTAFAALVDSLASDVIMQLVAAIAGQPDFSGLIWNLNGSQIRYGAFLTVLVNFLLLGAVLFGLVKLLKRAGMGNFRAQGSHECPYCKEFVPIDALKCKWCTADIEPGQAEDEDVKLIADRQRTAD
jgi:large conductance mechanosensitive channel